MALSLERYRQLKADNKIGWNTEALESTGKNIKSFIDGVNGQRQMSGAQWTADEFGKQRQQLDSLRGQLRYMQSYADSLKGTDAARYGKLNESIKSMGAALDESESWFAQNRDEEKRNNDYKTKKTGDALRELVQGGTDAAQAAEKYGLDKDELEKNYKDIRAYQKQGLREDKYGGMGFDDLTGVLRSADSMGQRIYDEIRRDYGDGLRNAQDFDRNAVFRSRAEKYGLTQDEVKRIYETFENNEGDKHYQSTALSDEDKAYVARRIIETGSVEELQELKKTLPKAQYFDGLRYQLNQAIEDKSEQRYYLDVAEQNPRVTKIMEDIAAIDKELPSLANDTGAPTGHKGQFENITDAQAARASYMRELTAQGYDAEKMVRYYKRYKERTENEQSQQALREWTQQNPVTAALGSVASVPVNMVGSVGDVVKVAMARLDELAGGDGWYDPKGTANYTAQNIRGSVNEMIGDENHIGQLLYSTGMSMGDMVLAAAVNAVPVVGQAASNAMFFSSAGVGAANEVIQNGGDINQATAAMIAQGSAELIFERISLDKLESFANGAPVKDAKSYFKNVMKQAFVEGSEEFNTTLANTLTDALINGGNSAVEREIRQYTEQGMSRDEAKTKAWETWLRGVVDDAVGGALSGGVLGGFAGAKNISDYIDLQQSLGGLAVTPEQMSALLGEDKAASADAAAALVKENGVDAVLEAVKQNGEKQTRQTAEHFAELREKGKLDEKDAAALLVKLAREQADTEMTDALARVAGAETKTDYKARTAQAESYNSDYDLSGAKIAEGKAQAGSSFGAAHPHGMAARGLNREQMTVLGVESSLEEYGRDDRTVTLRLSDGSVTDAAGVTLADFDFDRLLNLASGYDTIGARALLANYETAKANGASLDAYQAAFEELYRAGADGVRFEKAAENPQLRTLSDMIGEQAARAAVEAGNADGEIMVQARQALVRRVRVPGKKHLGQSRIGVEYGAKDVSDDTKALLNAFAEKIGKQIIFTDRLNADENGLYSGNVIYLNSNLEEHAIFAAALHEAMHNARVYDPEGFRHVQAFVVNYLTAEGKDTDALLGDIAARWGKDAATREVQMEELVCKTVEALAADSEALQKAIENKKNSGILKKVGDALRRIADRIMQYFKGDREQGQRGHNLQAQAFLDDAAALRQMAEMCSEAFENARENEREFGGKESEERYSIGMNEPYNQYSLKRIERFIAEGAKYKDLSMREFIDKTEEYGYGALPFLSIGREHPDFKPEIKTYYRIGEPRLSPDGTYKSSYNYADDKPEEGISVVTSEWLHSMKSVFFGVSNEDLKRRGVYKITGFELPSKGGDNEKLIIPMDWAVKTRITTKRGLEKAVADAEKDNAGAAVPKSPNGRYSKDDTIFDDFEDEEVMFTADGDIAFDGFGADAQRTIDVKEMVQEQGAEHAVYTLYNAAARTAEKAIKGHSGIQLGEQNYERIAKKLMRQFGISGKHSPEMQAVIADRVKAFADAVKQKKKADFDVLLNALATDCKRYLEHSGEYTRGAMQEDASKLYSTLKNATLILTPYAEKEVLDSFDGDIHQLRRRLRGYVHVGFEKDIDRYKHPIYIDDVIDTFAQETGDGYEGISPYFPDGERPDSLEGWKWLVDMLDLFQPKFVSRFESGEYYQSMDAAAVDMALAAGTAIADEMGQQAAVLRKIDKNAVREIAEDRKKAISALSALNKAKQLQAGEKLDRMRKRWQQEHMKRELAEENLSVLKSFVASDTKNYRAQYREQQRKAQYIRRLGRKLDSLTKRLDGKAAKNEYIPETLKKPILSVLELFDVSRPGTETPGYFGAFRQLDEVGARVNALALAYEKLKDSDHRNDKYENLGFDINALAFRDSVLTELRWLGELAEGKNVYQMTADDLQSVVEVMEELDRQLKSAVEMILDGKRVTIQEAADSCIGQTADVRFFKDGKNLLTDTLRAAKNKLVATSLDPVRYGRLLSGYHDDGVMYQLLRTLHQGEQKKILLMQRAYSVLQDITAKYSQKELQAVQRDAVEEFTMKDRRTGADVKLSQGLLLSIYLTDRQADGHRHLDNEKYSRYTVVPDLDYMNRNRVLPDTKGNRQRALGDKRHEVVFDRYTLQKIADYVKDTPLLRELADGMTQVFDGFLADEINKVSMEREGRMIATVQNYFPIRTDSDDPNKKYQVNNEGEGIFVDERLKSRSFTKQRVFSYNAIVMEDALEVFQRHVDATAEYCGMLTPVENIKKVLNSDNGEITVRRQLELKFGSDALHYLDKLLGDIQKRKDGTDENWFTRASGRAMGAALALNPRSTLKNWAAMPLANRYFGRANVSKAVVMGFVKGKDLVQKYDAYTPYMWYRAQGNGTVVGELSRRHGLYERFGERLDIMSWADQKVVNSLLYAAEAHVKQTTELEADSEEFKKEVARQFEQCVDESQPNSMLTSKPQFVRNNVMRALSLNAFASQRMAMGNGVIDSYLEYAARRSEYKQDKTDAAKKAMRDAHKQFLRSVAGVVESAVLQSLLGVLATMLIYHKWDDYKDENGEVTFASVASGVGLGVLKGLPEEIAGGFVWLDKACAAAEKLVDKDAYGAEFGAMSITAVTDMAEYIQGGKWDKVLGKAADLLGVPLLGGSNVQRLFGSAKSYLFDVLNGRLGYIDNSGKVDLSYMDVLIAEEFRKGNGKQAVWLRGVWETELESRGKSTATIDEKLAKALANGNEDIRNAAVAQVNGSFKAHNAARDKYVGLGMDGAVFDKAVTKVINGMEKEVKDQGFETAIEAAEYLKELGYQDAAAEKTAKKLLYSEDKPKSGGRYQLSDAFKAVVGGDEESLAVVKKDLLENGKTEEDIEKYLKSFSQTKELFEDYYANSGERFHRARKILQRIYGDELAAKYADFKKRYKDGR